MEDGQIKMVEALSAADDRVEADSDRPSRRR